jgi:hypothetical protein
MKKAASIVCMLAFFSQPLLASCSLCQPWKDCVPGGCFPVPPQCDYVQESERGWEECWEWGTRPLFGCEVDGEECIGPDAISLVDLLGEGALQADASADVAIDGWVLRARCSGIAVGYARHEPPPVHIASGAL